MSDDVANKVAEIIAEQAMVEPDTITAETTVDDLGLDSLALVEVVFGIEEAFDVSVPYNANDPSESDFKLGNFGEIVHGVKDLIANKDST
ncbi:MAG: acyl carrier protein [Pseudomonadota bacterium]